MGEAEWAAIRLARNWEAGLLPEAGGVQDQALRTVQAIETVVATWSRLRMARDRQE